MNMSTNNEEGDWETSKSISHIHMLVFDREVRYIAYIFAIFIDDLVSLYIYCLSGLLMRNDIYPLTIAAYSYRPYACTWYLDEDSTGLQLGLLLNACEKELDMRLNVNKSSCIRFGNRNRYNVPRAGVSSHGGANEWSDRLIIVVTYI